MKNNNITLNEKKSMSMKSKKAIMGSIFIAPALIFIFIFLLLPAILAFIYSFQNYNMLKPHAKVFVALQNYMEILKDPAFYKVLKNTVYFAAIVVPAQSAVALLLALIVNAKIKTSKVARICFFSPVITSMVVVSILWTFLYNKDNGMINSFLSQLGIPAQPFLLSEKQAMNSIIIMSIWQAAGYQMMIFLAGLQDVSPELYEAAQIDGANIFQRIFKVTIPCLVPTLIILTLLSIGNIFRGDFQMFYQLVGNNGPLFPITDVIDTFTFRSLIQSGEVGMSAAAGLYQSIFCFITIIITNKIVKSYDKDYSLF